MYAHATTALLEEGGRVRLTSMTVRVSTAVEMAGALMERATSSVSVTLATLECSVTLLMKTL